MWEARVQGFRPLVARYVPCDSMKDSRSNCRGFRCRCVLYRFVRSAALVVEKIRIRGEGSRIDIKSNRIPAQTSRQTVATIPQIASAMVDIP